VKQQPGWHDSQGCFDDAICAAGFCGDGSIHREVWFTLFAVIKIVAQGPYPAPSPLPLPKASGRGEGEKKGVCGGRRPPQTPILFPPSPLATGQGMRAGGGVRARPGGKATDCRHNFSSCNSPHPGVRQGRYRTCACPGRQQKLPCSRNYLNACSAPSDHAAL